ncbi:MAG: MATE family efflux transporter [Spirochaetales bacterium]|uniref:MATE family efflux transporter n=1 Tax=Bullifex sp. TaxID=2815808 RepID=UPI002A54DF9F|nr:MATE family efflux transporter [Bullifex sp.]MDD5973094.1 MATE family efflux transporter [Spirochaetales bacterium]MDD7271230.1 MATE family efflux transporter [Spirochaetales bacterium]MDY4066292.1 MATE family efflux transporter [Bullifex sp.]
MKTRIDTSTLFNKGFLKALIVPLLIEQILTLTIGMADTIMVANVGESAVSGISLVDSLSNLFIQLFAAFATGGAVVASQYLGRKDSEAASKAAKQLIYITALFSLLITIFGLVFNRGLLSLIFGHIEDQVMDHAVRYFIFILISYPFLALTNSANALCRSMGKSKITMAVSIVMNIINIGGNALFIYVFKLGTAGAGIASLLSRVVGATIMLIIISKKTLLIHVDGLFKFELIPSMIKRILRIGLPSGIENSMFHIGKVLVQSLIASFGTASIAANAVVNNIAGFANLPGAVIGMASITVIGQCVGAKRYDAAKYYAKKLLLLVFGMFILTCSFFYVTTPFLSSLYNLSDEAMRLSIINNHFLLICTLFIWPISFTLPNFLRAAGDARYTMTISMISMWTFRVVLSYILGRYLGLGLLGANMAMVIDWCFRSIMFSSRWLKGKWMTKKVI